MSPIISKRTINVQPVQDMLELCADAFDKMVDLAAQPLIDHHDWLQEQLQPISTITLTIVTWPTRMHLRDINDWLMENSARGGTLYELCAWRLQSPLEADGHAHVLAPGTIFLDGCPPRPPISFMPYSNLWGEVSRLSIRPYDSAWRSGSSFVAVVDSDNPFSS